MKTTAPAAEPLPCSPAAAGRAGAGRWPALALLIAIYSCNALDRHILSVVIEPVKREFGASDSQMGFLAGLGFSLAFGVAAIPLGTLIDRVNRVRLLAGLVMAWSVLTACGGFARNYFELLLARMGVGAAEAGGQPTAVSLISDLFTPERRAFAIGLFYLGSAIGSAASYLVGGYMAAAHGWRSAFLVAGLPGLFFALVLLMSVKEPTRGATEPTAADSTPPSVGAFAAFLVRHRGLLHLTVASALTGAVLASFWAWLPSVLVRSHGMDLKVVGVYAALAAGLFQGLSSTGGGWVASRVAGRHPERQALVAGFALLALAPLGLAFCFAPTPTLAIACAMGFGLFSGVWTGPTFGLALSLAPLRMRGRTSATIQVAASVAGAGLGPFLVGILSDAFGGRHSLAYALACVLALAAWAGLHFILAYRWSRPSVAAAAPSPRSTHEPR